MASKPRSSVDTRNVLILDHLNINHEKGRHDLVKAFYFDLLGMTPDPRKEENLEAGRKTLWANAGIHQFHLPESPTAQVFDGTITLAYASLGPLRARLSSLPAVLAASQFAIVNDDRLALAQDDDDDRLVLLDPWGNRFVLREDASAADPRGAQPGALSECLGLVDLCVHVPPAAGALEAP